MLSGGLVGYECCIKLSRDLPNMFCDWLSKKIMSGQ